MRLHEKISPSAEIDLLAFAAGVLPLNYVGPNTFTAFSSTLVLIKVQTCDRVQRLQYHEEETLISTKVDENAVN